MIKTQNLGYFLTFHNITIFIFIPISNKIYYTLMKDIFTRLNKSLVFYMGLSCL